MCNCRTDVIENIKNQKIDNKSIRAAHFNNSGLVLLKRGGKSEADVRFFEIAECTVDDRKRPVQFKIFQTFCPFCGKKVTEE